MSRLRPMLNEKDHIQGDPTAPLTVVEFGDYECPFCGRAYAVLKSLQNALGERLCFVFRNFPLTGAHPHAVLAAEAAEAAGAQGYYWPMHDLLYEHQSALDRPDLAGYAAQLGLDLLAFERDMRTHRHLDKLRADLHSGVLSGVNGTPTLFINGYRHDGGWDFDSLWEAMVGAGGAELIG